MPIESATFIDGLNASNPVGSTDKVQTLDDHVRLLKSTIKASFPNVAGAVTPTHTELNYVAGVTSAIQTQLNGKAASSHNHSAADLTSGTLPDARFPATLPAASGVNLTALNASSLGSGTVPDARFPATLPALNGSALTNLNGSSVASGTVGDARLSSQVVLKDTAISSVDNGDAADPGYRGIPQGSTAAGSDNISLSHAGKYAYYTGSGGHTFTIPANASVAFPLGSVVTFINSGTGNLTIAITSDTLILAGGSGSTGSRTLVPGGIATAIKIASTAWLITGPGLS